MKNILSAFSLIIFGISPLFAQHITQFAQYDSHYTQNENNPPRNDSIFFGNMIVKVNPTLLMGGAIAGIEYGGIIQTPLLKKGTSSDFYYNVDVFLGVGVDKDYAVASPQGYSPSGYTIRGGFYYFFTKERKDYLQLQYFFRKWSFINIIDYPYGSNTVLDPTSIIGSEGSNPDFRYNAYIYVNCIDLIYGHQVPLFHSRRFIFDWYIGAGWRLKIIDESALGYYHDGQYYPNAPSGYSSQVYHYPDVKLGCMMGYIL